ncbi:MAG: hypothetical protein O2781_03425 [Bacteroidetes bacterium]|nr:hypothetical protein [Bacteroidota bacterium]
MKKTKISIFTCVIIITFGLSSCEKEEEIELTYCAECYEINSGYQNNVFCGESEEVDNYIQELTSSGSNAGQSWSCSKVAG